MHPEPDDPTKETEKTDGKPGSFLPGVELDWYQIKTLDGIIHIIEFVSTQCIIILGITQSTS